MLVSAFSVHLLNTEHLRKRHMGSSLRSVCEAYWLETQPESYPFGDWIADQREADVTWRQIERDVYERTDGIIEVSINSLMSWYPDAVAAGTKAAA